MAYVATGYVSEGYIQEGITIDWNTKIIYVPRIFLTPLAGNDNYQLNTNAFRIALRDIEDNELGIPQPVTHNHNTEVTLDGLTYARIVEILSPYTITFEEFFDENGDALPYKVFLNGSNNNILTVTNLNSVSVSSANSAGLINLTELQYGAYDDGATINIASPNSGTTYPTYSQIQPGNKLTEAVEVCNSLGFDNLYVIGDLTVEATETISGFNVWGKGATLNIANTTLTFIDGANTHLAKIHDCLVTGFQGGENTYVDCMIDGLTDFHCVFIRCGLKDGTGGYTMKQSVFPSSGHTTYFKDCFSDEGEAIIDRDTAKESMRFDGFHGDIKFINMNNAATGDVHIHMNGGHVHIDSTCTEGVIHLSGNFELENETGGTVVKTGLLNELFNIKTLIEMIRPTHQGLGRIIYVNQSYGVSTATGESAETAVRDFADAHALATDGAGDIIQFVGTYTHVEDMVCTKNNVHIRSNGRNITFQPATTGGTVLTLGAADGTNGWFCSTTAMLIDGTKAGTFKADYCMQVNGKFSLIDAMWLKQSVLDCLRINGGDYHVIRDPEFEKADRHGISMFDGDLASGSPREITITGRGNIYLQPNGSGIHIDADSGELGSTTRLIRVLGDLNIERNNVGLYAATDVDGLLIGPTVQLHNNTTNKDINTVTNLLDESSQMEEIYGRLGLDKDNPLTNKSDGGIAFGDVVVNATPSGSDIIQTRA